MATILNLVPNFFYPWENCWTVLQYFSITVPNVRLFQNILHALNSLLFFGNQ